MYGKIDFVKRVILWEFARHIFEKFIMSNFSKKIQHKGDFTWKIRFSITQMYLSG